MKFLERLIEIILREHRRLKRLYRVIFALACVVVFVTTYALTLPAISIDKETAARMAGMKAGAPQTRTVMGWASEETGATDQAANAAEPGEASGSESERDSADEAGSDETGGSDSNTTENAGGDESESADGNTTGNADGDTTASADGDTTGSTDSEYAGATENADSETAENADGGAAEGTDAEAGTADADADTAEGEAAEAVTDDATGESAGAGADDAAAEAAGKDAAAGAGTADTSAAAESAAAAMTADAVATDAELITEETELTAEGSDYKVYVTVTAEAKLPKETTLQVREITKEKDEEEYQLYFDRAQKELKDKYDDNTSLSFARFYDISFIYKGAKIEPAGKVMVRIEYDKAVEVTANAGLDTVHFDEQKEDKPEFIESELKTEDGLKIKTGAGNDTGNAADKIAENAAGTEKKADKEVDNALHVNEVSFESDKFSVYGICGTETFEATVLAGDGRNYKITVECGADAEVPKGSHLEVQEILPEGADNEDLAGEGAEESADYADYVAKIENALDLEEGSAPFLRLFDIKIVDKNGDKVEIAAPVDVRIELADMEGDVATDEYTNVVHFADNGEEVQVLSDIDISGDTVSFAADGFSAYAIVAGPESVPLGWQKVESLDELVSRGQEGVYIGHTAGYYFGNELVRTSEGRIGISKTKPACSSPPANAAKYYFEKVEGTDNKFYAYCYKSDGTTKQYVKNENNNSLLLVEGASAAEAGATAFTVTAGSNDIFKFNNGQWYWNQQKSESGNRFCSWNTANDPNNNMNIWYYDSIEEDPYKLDGKTYGLMNWDGGVTGRALMNDEIPAAGSGDKSALAAKSLTVMSKPHYEDGQLFVPNDSDISMWTFEWIDQDHYYISTVADGSTRYLKVTADGIMLSAQKDESCKVQVVPGSGTQQGGKICLKSVSTGDTVTFTGQTANGFSTGGDVGREWLYLVELSELTSEYIRTYSADKVSVSDPSVTNGSKVIVYTRVWNEAGKKYDYYAIDHDGSLKQVFESGDTIEWVGGQHNTLLWDFVEYTDEVTGEPNYYYELFNEYSEKYLAPQITGNQILSDDPIGINMNGRRDGHYYSPIMAWDNDNYVYAGLKTEDGAIVSKERVKFDDFYFAEMKPVNVDDTLTDVPTIDNNQYGIEMKMIDFGTRAEMSNFLDDDTGGLTTKLVQGLLSTNLEGGERGYPTAKGGPLGDLFSDVKDVNHLFIRETYNETGYFEYDSAQNFASLKGRTEGDFTVYKELGSYDSAGERYTLKHGQFLPYNDLKAGTFCSVNRKNLYPTTSDTQLPDLDPRKNEQLYTVENNGAKANTYFGMELSASFTQTPNGLDEWGHDIIFEFTGDDDFWLYVDGELVIDLGGIHSAVPGSVNFRTGEVNVNGKRTTLKDLYYNNYKKRGHSDAEAKAYVDGIFVQDDEGHWIFDANTTHTMRIFYMERGAGASNLHMRFNLASVKPGTVQLTKKLSGVDNTESVMSDFAYQIWFKKEGDDTEYRLKNATPDPQWNTDYVLYKGSVNPVTYKEHLTIGGADYEDVFLLKPDEVAEISFPEGMTSYRIVECGVNTGVFKDVKVNDASIYADGQLHPGASDNHKDFGIDYKSTKDRATVKYENEVDPEALRTVTITKKLFREDGTSRIPFEEDSTMFQFRLSLASEFDDLAPADVYTYHVKDGDGNYCYWDKANKRFASTGINDYDNLSEEQKSICSFTTSIYGTIANVPADHTLELRNVLVGTQFKIVEREKEVPDGYSFQKYQYNNRDYTDEDAGLSDIVRTGEDPHVDICNIKGWGLRVNKIWSDADYMEDRDPTYFGVFILKHENQGQGHGENVRLVDGTVRQLKYTDKPQTLYWYFKKLEDGKTLEDYVIREVKLTGGHIVVHEDGSVTGFGQAHPISNGKELKLDGRQKGESESSEFTYTVLYEQGTIEEGSNVRIDTVTNNRPGLVLKKTKWDGTSPLAGAAFELKDDQGNLIGTFTSDEAGMITTAFLRDDVDYTLTETSAPQGYNGLQEPMTLRLHQRELTVTYEDEDYYVIEQGTEMPTLIVKDRPFTFLARKTDLETGEPLQGVEFALHKEKKVGEIIAFDENPMPGYESLTTDEAGIIPQLDNTLPPGKYQLREKTSLPGYQKLSSHTVFSVSSTGAVTLLDTHPDEVTLVETTGDDGTVNYVLTIPNIKLKNVSVWKTDQGHTAVTNGADFALYKAEDYNDKTEKPNAGAVPVITGTTGSDGILTLGGLETGEYRLVETRAPEGYSGAETAIRVTVTGTEVKAMQAGSVSEVARDSDEYWVPGQQPGTWQIRVWNNQGVELPASGGIGTGIFTILGMVLAAGAAISLVLRRGRRI